MFANHVSCLHKCTGNDLLTDLVKVLITRTRTGNNSIMQSGCVIYIFSVNFFLNIKMSTVWNFNSVKSDAVKVLPNAFAYEKQVYKYF